MQEALHGVHAHHDAECDPDQEIEHYYHLCYSIKYSRNCQENFLHCVAHLQGLLEEHFCQLRMSQGKSPQTEIRCSVGDSTQDILDGLDQLMHKNLS